MEVFVVSFLVFASMALLLLAGQWLRQAPLPVGCTPGGCVEGEGTCCRQPASREAGIRRYPER